MILYDESSDESDDSLSDSDMSSDDEGFGEPFQAECSENKVDLSKSQKDENYAML